MPKVAVVTDSTAYFPENMLRGLPVYSLPLQVIWGEEIYRDGVDITPQEFYTRLPESKIMPSTSQVTPVQFRDLYSRLLDEGNQIISIHISGKLSGTLDSAVQAKAGFENAAIELFDSQSSSMAMGFMVLAVARAAANGATLKDCLAIAEKARASTDVFFAVSTLEFLHRGGRIGGAQAFLGTALGLKPILKVQDGRVEAVEKIRTMNKAVDRLSELVLSRMNGHRPIRLAALHANAPIEARMLLERVQSKFSVLEVQEAVVAELSPVIGTHTGPGTVGLAYMVGM